MQKSTLTASYLSAIAGAPILTVSMTPAVAFTLASPPLAQPLNAIAGAVGIPTATTATDTTTTTTTATATVTVTGTATRTPTTATAIAVPIEIAGAALLFVSRYDDAELSPKLAALKDRAP
jgi:hypothetical protein